jgi:hypothetical protein
MATKVGPGVDLAVDVASKPNMGVRGPRHNGFLYGVDFQRLHPWMMAPVRPGEVLEGVSLQGETWLDDLISYVHAPITYVEDVVWYVPLSALPSWFKTVFTATAKDLDEGDGTGAGTEFRGSALRASLDATNDESYGSVGLLSGERAWAGQAGSSYVPYPMHCVAAIADAWYERRASGSGDITDVGDDILEPPRVGAWIQSMGVERFAVGATQDPNLDATLGAALEAVFLFSKTEMSYAEYLAGNGIDPRFVEGIPKPLMVDQSVLTPHQSGGNALDDFADVGASFNGEGWPATGFLRSAPWDTSGTLVGDIDAGWVWAQGPVGQLHSTVRRTARRRLRIEEPGFIVGTTVLYDSAVGSGEANGGHFFDCIFMRNGGLWADRSSGDVNESSMVFIDSPQDRDGVAQTGSPFVQNVNNLFFHGEAFQYHNGATSVGNAFGYYDPFGRQVTSIQGVMKRSCQLRVRSDLVG